MLISLLLPLFSLSLLLCFSFTHLPLIAFVLMVLDFAIEIDKVLASLRQPQLKVLPIEVFLHVLMALLKFSDYDFLSFIEVGSVGHSASLIWVFVLRVQSCSSPSHTLHIEDDVRVDDGDYRHDDQACTSCNLVSELLGAPRIKDHEEKTNED